MLPSVNLKDAVPLEKWHKTNFITGLGLLVISLFLNAPWVPARLVGTLGLGMMFLGLGDWKLIREQGKTSWTQWALGWAFWLFGLATLGWAVGNIGLFLYRG